jgi:putative transcriptional regulator
MTAKAKNRLRSKIAEAARETASGLHRIGLLDAKTMREFDASSLTTIEPPTGKQSTWETNATQQGSARQSLIA